MQGSLWASRINEIIHIQFFERTHLLRVSRGHLALELLHVAESLSQKSTQHETKIPWSAVLYTKSTSKLGRKLHMFPQLLNSYIVPRPVPPIICLAAREDRSCHFSPPTESNRRARCCPDPASLRAQSASPLLPRPCFATSQHLRP